MNEGVARVMANVMCANIEMEAMKADKAARTGRGNGSVYEHFDFDSLMERHHIRSQDVEEMLADKTPTRDSKTGELLCPFKKHKGKLLSDCPKQYLDWLLEQPWLEFSYPEIYKELAAIDDNDDPDKFKENPTDEEEF